MWSKKQDKDGNIIYNKGELIDLWALGITFFRLITGKYPFELSDSFLKLKTSVLEK
jgi:serine/threonine protein kinase